MSAKKKTKPAPKKSHDLTTAEGSKAWERDFKRRKRIAEEFYRVDFGDINDQLNAIDRQVVAVLADLTAYKMHETIHEVACLAKAAHLIRCAIPNTKTESEVSQ